jgi:phage baseplate assembly protein W
MIVAQSIYRRLITSRGALKYDLDYGLDVADFLQQPMTPAYRASIAGMIKNEILKDDRVQDVAVSAEVSLDGSTITIVIKGTCSDPTGPFALTMAVSPAATLVVAIQGTQ